MPHDGSLLPPTASRASRDRFALAQRIAADLSDVLGDETAVWGSVARGTADEDSDVEFVTWLQPVPPIHHRLAALRVLGIDDVIVESDERGVVIRVDGVWVEIAWRSSSEDERLLDRLCNAETTDRRDLVTAWALTQAIPMSRGDSLRTWQQRLRHYPPDLAERLIHEATDFWRFPHRVDGPWTLARRGASFALTHWVLADIRDVLRCLWAFNRRWEPDWKDLSALLDDLERHPRDTATRINAILSSQDDHARALESRSLIRDTLEMIDGDHDVGSALATLERSLQRHS